ncbi:MAG: hypothetical protein KDA65_19815 [Planctomycetaceae bacterium]|nr:hypothetical protein [Planctomycetaceae bacterium]
MAGLENDSRGKELMVEIPSLGQIVDAWNPEKTARQWAEIDGAIAVAIAALDAGKSVPLAWFLGQTTGQQIDEDLEGK